MEFEGKRVLVTGAASGIGRATAIRFAAEGAKVTIGDRNAVGLEETAAMMASAPVVQPFDAVDPASCRQLVAAAATDGLDVLCNIAGILKWGPSETFAVEDFDLVLKINTTAVFAVSQAALPYLVRSKGVIVNTASAAGLSGIAYNAAYSASKHAVVGLTKSLAVEYAAKGVRVNAICPGHVETPMTAEAPPIEGDMDWALVMRNAPKLLNGSCAPEDIADLFAFLASGKARKITGATFTIDGGQLAG
ncbi:MAG: SDR family oxidoreductase [Sphingomonadales bacterium]|nr:SDR family oxidoreductase [Sphingomonadales bacterium]